MQVAGCFSTRGGKGLWNMLASGEAHDNSANTRQGKKKNQIDVGGHAANSVFHVNTGGEGKTGVS